MAPRVNYLQEAREQAKVSAMQARANDAEDREAVRRERGGLQTPTMTGGDSRTPASEWDAQFNPRITATGTANSEVQPSREVAYTPTAEESIAARWREFADTHGNQGGVRTPDWSELSETQRGYALKRMGRQTAGDIGTVTQGANRDASFERGMLTRNDDGTTSPDWLNGTPQEAQNRINAYGTARSRTVNAETPDALKPQVPIPAPGSYDAGSLTAKFEQPITQAPTIVENSPALPRTTQLPILPIQAPAPTPNSARNDIPSAAQTQNNGDDVFSGTSIQKAPFRKIWGFIKRGPTFNFGNDKPRINSRS